MKRIALGLAAVLLLNLAPGGTALAQTSSSSVAALQAQIAALLQQIKTLQAQIQQLEIQKQQTVSQLLTMLREGMRGDEVSTLQALLAADAEIYPKGLVTGYFGQLTANAVKRFQKKFGIEQVGFVGPKTLKKLNEYFEEHPLGIESSRDDDDDDDSDAKKMAIIINASGTAGRLCAIVPPRHLIAPGWLRKHDKPLVPVCQILPPGIIKKLPPSPTSTTDVIPPAISGVAASPSVSSTAITWATNEAASSQVFYGATTAYGSSTVLDGTLVTGHAQTLSGLSPVTTYHFQVQSRDAAGNLATSSDQTFVTLAVADVTAPVISGIAASPSTSSVAVSWVTNEPANSRMFYGTTTAYGSSTTLDTVLVASHGQMILGLLPATTYHFRIQSQDASGNTATSSDQIVVTLALPDTTPPVISALTATPSSMNATVNWTTNEPGTTKVYYSTVTPLVLTATSTLSMENVTLVTDHSLLLTGLTATTTYYFAAESRDASGNVATSSEQTFTTTGL